MSSFISPSMEYQVEELLQWAMTHSIVMALPPASDAIITHAPLTLKPYPFLSSQFQQAVSLAEHFNELVDLISLDSDWLLQTLRLTAENDFFTGKLVQIFKIVNAEGIKQPLRLGINRSDYMQHSIAGDPRSLLQVEINTVASSFGSLSTKIYEMYQSLLPSPLSGQLPKNEALQKIAAVLALSHNEFIKQRTDSETQMKTILLIIVQNNERNFADQRLLEFELLQSHGLKMLRVTLEDIHLKGSIDPTSSELLYAGTPVSVVYFRAGYSPDDYIGNNEWEARLLIERSRAVKCPSVAYQLVGTKKVQQALAAPGAVERFLGQENPAVQQLRAVFAGLYPLEADGTEASEKELQAVIERAVHHPSRFVMKPQREGGGNNLYGERVVRALTEMTRAELSAFILMERIVPPSQTAALLRKGELTEKKCLCELGIFGVFLRSGKEKDPLRNEYAGYLLRVKPEESDEGGVAAGYAVLSCPLLV